MFRDNKKTRFPFPGQDLVPEPAHEVEELEGARVDRFRRKSRTNFADQEQPEPGFVGPGPSEERFTSGGQPDDVFAVGFDAQHRPSFRRQVGLIPFSMRQSAV